MDRSSKDKQVKHQDEKDDVVDEAGKESFPASDSPAWNGGVDKNKTKKDDKQPNNKA